MRRPVLTVAAAALTASLALAGCSSTSGGTASPATSSAAGPTTASGEDATTWATSFCAAAQPVVDAFSSLKTTAGTLDRTDAAAVKGFVVDFYTTFGTAFGSAGTAIGALGAPPVQGAETYASGTAATLAKSSSAFAALAAKAAAVDAKDTAAVTALTTEVGNLPDPTGGAFDRTEENVPAELDDALTNAPGCAALDALGAE